LEGTLRRKLHPIFWSVLLFTVACGTALGQATKAQLEVSETFFTLAAALNSCGYDAGVEASMPLRQAVRTEVRAALTQSPEAKQAGNAICQFWIDHQLPGKDDDVTPYLSLALDLGSAPEFAPTIPEADLAPEASARISGAGESTPRSGFSAAYADRSLFKGAVQQLSWPEICGLHGAAAFSGAGGFEKLWQQLLHGCFTRP
jgi:hypothetical protein